jgi:acetyl esterase/lipase
MLILRLVAAFAIILACTVLSSAELPESVRSAVLVNHSYDVTSNIVYKVANNYELKLDVYRPHSSIAPVPVVMMIHGGGWIISNKDDYVLTAGPYLAMGFAVVNVEYRLGKVSLAPAAVEDCQCALRWIGAHAKEYNFDLEKVIVTGPSAGGHLALTTGMIPESAGFADECASLSGPNDSGPRAAAIINLFGITDVADLLAGPNLRAYAVTWLGGQSGREELAKRLSPLTYVRPGVPPVLTIHGDADPTVPYSHAVRLHQALDKAGVRNQLLTIHGGGHGGFTAEQDLLVFETTRSFLASLGIHAIQR